jgi:hypothetical protein
MNYTDLETQRVKERIDRKIEMCPNTIVKLEIGIDRITDNWPLYCDEMGY